MRVSHFSVEVRLRSQIRLPWFSVCRYYRAPKESPWCVGVDQKSFLRTAKLPGGHEQPKMTTVPFWIDSAPIRRFPRLQKNTNVDVVVIGAGVTGITTAYLLKKAGLTVALIERERVASIDTGHTTAHLTYVTDVGLQELADNFGNDHAQAAWDAGAAAIDEIERIVWEEGIECEFTRVPAYVHVCVDGFSQNDISELKKEASLAAKLGFDAAYLKSAPYFNLPAVRFPNEAKFHPRKYLRSLVVKVPGNGSHVFEKTAATDFDTKKSRVKANRHWISFDRLIMATNNPLVGFASITSATLLQTKLSLYTSYALGAQVPSGTIPEGLFWDTREPYDYLRVDRHRRFDYVVYGGEDHKTGQKRKTQRAYARLLARLKKIVPEARVDHRWSGQVISTPDGLPYIGENAEQQFIATGFCGNGKRSDRSSQSRLRPGDKTRRRHDYRLAQQESCRVPRSQWEAPQALTRLPTSWMPCQVELC